jgi:signal peptidase I
MRARPHIQSILWGTLTLALLGSVWFLFAPAAVGGSTSYVVTDGVSMEPRFHSGDLALVRQEGDYRVGQIVAYHNRELGTVVLHRIIGRDGSRYIFKGDHNNFTDFEHPTRSQLIGALWIHVPGAGRDLHSFRSPALIGLLFAIGTLLLGGVSFARRRRRRKRGRAEAAGAIAAAPAPAARRATASENRLGGVPAAAIVACALVAMAPFFILAMLAFTRPAAAVIATSVPYRQTGKLSYTASAPAGPTYPSGSVHTGEPLFTHVVRSVRLRFAYRFSSAAPHGLAARGWLSASVTSTSGWRTTVPLGPPTAISGDSGILRGRLDIDSLLALVDRVESVTAVRGSYTLTVTPHVALGGKLAGAPIQGRFAPASKFALNSLEIRPVTASGAPSEAASATTSFEHSASGSVTARRSRPAHISIGPVSLTVGAARAIALGGLALVACALCAALALAARPRRQSPVAAILSRYGGAIVPVECVWQQPGVAVIDVADIDSLARIAAHYERSILHERAEYGDAFWVSDESGQFRYAVLDGAWEAAAPSPSGFSEEAAPAAWAAAPGGGAPAEQVAADERRPAPGEAVSAAAGEWAYAAHETGVSEGWAPAPAAATAAQVQAGSAAGERQATAGPAAGESEIAAGDLRPGLPAETLRFGTASPSPL